MIDLKIQATCPHTIFQEPMTVEGLSPSFFSTLRYTADGATGFMQVREFSATEGLSNFIYSQSGMTNWNLDSTNYRILHWNTLGINQGTASFLDGSTFINPQPLMLIDYRTIISECPRCV